MRVDSLGPFPGTSGMLRRSEAVEAVQEGWDCDRPEAMEREEMIVIARIIAGRLNDSRGAVHVIDTMIGARRQAGTERPEAGHQA